MNKSKRKYRLGEFGKKCTSAYVFAEWASPVDDHGRASFKQTSLRLWSSWIGMKYIWFRYPAINVCEANPSSPRLLISDQVSMALGVMEGDVSEAAPVIGLLVQRVRKSGHASNRKQISLSPHETSSNYKRRNTFQVI